MTRFRYIPMLPVLIVSFLVSGCMDVDRNPYSGKVNVLHIVAEYPEGYGSFAREGVQVVVENIKSGVSYVASTDASGAVSVSLVNGLYRVNISDQVENDIFNGYADNVKVVDGDVNLGISLLHSVPGSIVIKEIYCGGCKRLPLEGDYQYDKYVILHNNDSKVQYLDGLCFGTLSPYNSTASNPWTGKDPVTGETVFQDFLPVIQAVWQFGGDGTTFPLAPGEDAVLVICGAIDHTVQYPLSVNLNKPDYFVCYNSTYFSNTLYHPAPGDQIDMSGHILNVVIKTGQANAYTFSLNSPTVLLFRPEGVSMSDYVMAEGNVIPVPGSSIDNVVKIPPEWVVDAVEVFDGRSAANNKRLMPSLDAGYVSLSDVYLGHTLMRYTDELLSASAGYEVLKDTNNSREDFYEREQQSLHE